MSNFILVHNYDNDVTSLISVEQFDTLRYMFSKNISYKHLSQEEYNRMELLRNAN